MERKNINIKLMPRKAFNELETRLNSILQNLEMLIEKEENINSSNHNSSYNSRSDFEGKIRREKQYLNTLIREAFLKFMVSILHNYKKYLKTVTRKPNLTALDRNLSIYFDCDGFIRDMERENPSCQYFFKELVKTQLFYDCIMNLSFTTELQPEIADSFEFFSNLCSKYNNNLLNDAPLLDLNQYNNQTIFILPPLFLNKITSESDSNDNKSNFVYSSKKAKFPLTNTEILQCKHINHKILLDDENKSSFNQENECRIKNLKVYTETKEINMNEKLLHMIQNTPIGIRTENEKQQTQKKLELAINKELNNSRINSKFQAFYFLSQAYSLWFIYLPEYVKSCETFEMFKKKCSLLRL